MLFTVLFAKTLLLRIYGSLPVIFWVFHNLKNKKIGFILYPEKVAGCGGGFSEESRVALT